MKQVKCLTLTALTVLSTLTACQNSEDFSQESLQEAAGLVAAGDDAVRFGTVVGRNTQTRAAYDGYRNNYEGGIITTNGTNKLTATGFGVFGYVSSTKFTDGVAVEVAPNFMYNQEVTSSGASWTYTPVKYWPNGQDSNNAPNSPSSTASESAPQYLNFYAYAPYASNTNGPGITGIPSNKTGNLIFTYKMPSAPTQANIVDFLWGTRGNDSGYELASGAETNEQKANTYNVNLTKQNVTETVDFLFKHALAKVGTQLKVVYDIDGNGAGTIGYGSTDNNTLVTLSSITLTVDKSTLISEGTFDISDGTWKSYETPSESSGNIAVTGGTIVTDLAEPSDVSSASYNSGTHKWTLNGNVIEGVTTAAKDVYTTLQDGIMLIPGNNQKLTVSVTYVVRTYDTGLDKDVAGDGEGTWTKVTQTITNSVTLPEMLPNKYYALVLHLGLTSVKFSAEVGGWDDGDAIKEVWLPSNVVSQTTSTTIAAGKSVTVRTAASTSPYTINLTGLTLGSTVAGTIAPTEEGYSVAAATYKSGDAVQDDGKATIKVTLKGNGSSSETKTKTVTITETKSGSTETTTTTVVIVQDKATS